MAHIDEFVQKLAEELEKNTASGNLKDIMISSMNEIIRKKIFGVSENLSLIENGRIDRNGRTGQDGCISVEQLRDNRKKQRPVCGG